MYECVSEGSASVSVYVCWVGCTRMCIPYSFLFQFAALDTGQHLSSSVCDIFWGLDEVSFH